MIRWRPVRGARRVHRRTSDGMSLTSRDSMTREPGSWPWPDTLDVPCVQAGVSRQAIPCVTMGRASTFPLNGGPHGAGLG
jgi:hypothetical protein